MLEIADEPLGCLVSQGSISGTETGGLCGPGIAPRT